MDSICVISYTGINDSRALRTIKLMASIENIEVDFFFIDEIIDYSKFRLPGRVNYFPIVHKETSFLQKVRNHSFIYLNSRFFLNPILSTGKKYKIVYCHDLTTSFVGYQLKKKIGAKIIYDVHDLYVETINQFFPRNASGVKRIIFNFLIWEMRKLNKIWEKKFFKYVDLTLTTNENYSKFLKKTYSVKEITITPNYPEFFNFKRTEGIYKKLNIHQSVKIVLYHGALTEGRYLREIFESAQFFNDNVRLVVIGDGPLKKEITKITNVKNNIILIDFIPYSELFEFISGASLGLMLIEPINLSKKFALANKVTEYMSVGIPVFASKSPENERIISFAQSGYLYKYENSESLALEINKALEDPNLKTKGMNGRSAFETEFNWDVHKKNFLTALNKLLN